MKYKVGEKVEIVKDRTDGMNSFGKMDCYLGGIMTIAEVLDINYKMVEDKGYWSWDDEMIKGLAFKKSKSKVIFNNPATIVFNDDGTKTVVKVHGDDMYDPIKGFLYAYFEKTSGKNKKKCREFFAELEAEYIKQTGKVVENQKERRNEKFKIGDKVRLREGLIPCETYGFWGLEEQMYYFAIGKICEIDFIEDAYGDECERYGLKGCVSKHFSREMLELIKN